MVNMEQIDTKYNCETCNYKCIYPAHWKQHIESEKHKNNGIRKTRCDKVLEPKCKHCDYTTKNLTCMKVHCWFNACKTKGKYRTCYKQYTKR
jgi:hypothetical protein